jgi:thiamine monophosphate kinase
MRPLFRKHYPEEALKMACTGGEDYELVLVGPLKALESLRLPENRIHLGIIGEIVDDPEHRVRLLDGAGNEITFERGGWDAFR